MQYGLYKLLSTIIFATGFPFFYLYSFLTGRHREGLYERLGLLNKADFTTTGPCRFWIHAASVGEVQAARALLQELHLLFPEADYFLSTMTRQGQQVARRQLAGQTTCFYAPLDISQAVRASLATVRPTCYICLETELWPTFLTEAHKQGVKLILLNGRISKGSFERYRKIPKLIKPLLNRFAAISAISEQDRQRFLDLGGRADRLSVTGNAKYDIVLPDEEDVFSSYRERLALNRDQPVLILGSTHTGEERLFLEAFDALGKKRADFLLIIAPRHVERVTEIETLLKGRGLGYDLLSRLENGNRRHQVIVVDTMGELADLYSAGTFIFCGGSLVPKGGHNVLEAARWGKPVFYGPHTRDFSDAVELLESAGASFAIDSPDRMLEIVLTLLADPVTYGEICRKARQVARNQQGSAKKQALLIKALCGSGNNDV